MDDIYDDLDNYEDLNIVEELKKENHDLKLKLEEYTIAMSKLQKDFDKLSSDFKKLEMNYSSLLKTAKVEIERKTKIITDLNIEKDMIVLNALQNRKVNDARKIKSITKPFTKGASNDSSFGKARNTVPLADNIQGKNNNSERKEDIRFSSVDTTTTSGNTDIATKLIQFANSNSENVEIWSDRTSDTKENTTKKNKNVENPKPSNTQALSIKNRRKSMPASRSHAKYSSDEEREDRYCSNDVNRKSLREDPNRQIIDMVHSDRHRYKGFDERIKPSEMPNMDENYYGYHEPSRDSYHRSRNDRHYGIDKHKSRNKYDISLRHRRHFSPERSRRAPRNDEYQRQDYSRHRVLESPPPEPFQHYQQRSQETRYKRDRDNAYELDKREHFDRYTSKHKTNSEHYDEPISKRLRRDSQNKISEEEMRWNRDRPLEKPVPDLYDNLNQDMSCQSPDFNVTDAVSSHTIKEIMNTAATPLEDPRLHSKRYILKTNDNNVELSTVIGRNVDLKLVDNSCWDDLLPEVPHSLKRRPSQCSEDIVKEIYMDIDNPVSNFSTESGEILSFDVDDDIHDINNANKNNVQRCEPNVGTESAKLPDKSDDKSSLTKYKIPKLKRNELENKLCSNLDVGGKNFENKSEKPIGCLKKDKNNKLEKEPVTQLETPISSTKASSVVQYNEHCKDSMSSIKELVAGDLELSDETCDNTEIQKKMNTDDKAQSKDKYNKVHDIKYTSSVLLQDKATMEDNSSENHDEKQNLQEKSSEVSHNDHAKRNSKKRCSKTKENAKTDTTDRESARKVKSKRDTKDPKEIKTKFSELFGDSSSLITPEDLGIMAAQAQAQSSAAYVPICEDAQDAVDVSVSNAAKVQTRSSKLKSLETVPVQECPETSNDIPKTETITKNLHKSNNDTKKKTRKNTELTDKMKIREVYQSLTADKLTENNLSSQNLVAKEAVKQVTDAIVDEPKQPVTTATVQEPCQAVLESNQSNKPQLVEEHTATTSNIDMPAKQSILMRALATSTPQKEPQQDNCGSVTNVGGQASSCPSSKEASCDNAAADMSSNNETANSQNDADVPDVRIFVRRKRRIKTPKQKA